LLRRSEQGVPYRAAARVEDRARDPVGHGDERPLRLADVPGRLPSVEVLKAGTVDRVNWHWESPFRVVKVRSPPTGHDPAGGCASFAGDVRAKPTGSACLFSTEWVKASGAPGRPGRKRCHQRGDLRGRGRYFLNQTCAQAPPAVFDP